MTSGDPHAARLTSGLTGSRYDGYLYQPIPRDADDDVAAVVDAYRAAPPADRAAIQAQILGEPADVLECFAERQAVVAVRTRSVEPIRLGLVAMGMSLPHGDRRETVMGLSKLDYSSGLLGVDLADVAEEVAEDLPDHFRYFLAKFLARDDRDDLLLSKMGFGAYGSGPDFVYDNLCPHEEPQPSGIQAETFVMRPRHFEEPMSIRVKDGTLVAIDSLAQRWTFPLEGPDAPQEMVRFLQSRGRYGGVAWHWAVTDRAGRAILSGSEDHWDPEDFGRLAEVAGLRYEPDAAVSDSPPERHDYVNFIPVRMSMWVFIPLLMGVPVLLVSGLFGLWDGYPWLWPAFWAASGAWFIRRQVLDDRITEKNCAALPPDERPTKPLKQLNPARSVGILTAIALVPPAVVYLIQGAPPPS